MSLQTEIVELIQTSSLFKNEEERTEWINDILPQLNEEKLEKTKDILLNAQEVQAEFNAKKLEALKQKYGAIKMLIAKARKIAREDAEAKALKKDQEEMIKMDAELTLMP